MRIIPRSVWRARPPARRHEIAMPTPELWLHHTAGDDDAGDNRQWADDVAGIQAYHMDARHWSDIGYSFLVDQSGQVWEGRGAGVAGGHTKGRNTVSHGICAIGNFEIEHPSPEMIASLARLVAHGLLAGWWATGITGAHRDAPGAATACCGQNLVSHIPGINELAASVVHGVDVTPVAEGELTLPVETVEAAYRVFAGRKGDPGGVAHWARAGVTEDELALILLRAEGLPRIWERLSRLVQSR